jgi:hypothetical protein
MQEEITAVDQGQQTTLKPDFEPNTFIDIHIIDPPMDMGSHDHNTLVYTYAFGLQDPHMCLQMGR